MPHTRINQVNSFFPFSANTDHFTVRVPLSPLCQIKIKKKNPKSTIKKTWKCKKYINDFAKTDCTHFRQGQVHTTGLLNFSALSSDVFSWDLYTLLFVLQAILEDSWFLLSENLME